MSEVIKPLLYELKEVFENWDKVVKENEEEIRNFLREEELRELRALEIASKMWVRI
ncbi:MAG: hypothetical protein QFX36_00160 [Archaeoglobales archaeon]|nr:hypothetical protein [Archaeoglobales archaeon]MDI9643175.1 hypothetical protein [Archaeoglobales archaeon]